MAAMDNTTTIRVRRETSQRINTLKVHPRQTVDEVLNIIFDEREQRATAPTRRSTSPASSGSAQ